MRARDRVDHELVRWTAAKAARRDASQSMWRRHYGETQRGIFGPLATPSLSQSLWPIASCKHPSTRLGLEAIAWLVTHCFGAHELGEVADVAIRDGKRIDTRMRKQGSAPHLERRIVTELTENDFMMKARHHHARFSAACSLLASTAEAWKRGEEDESAVRDVIADVLQAYADAWKDGVVSKRAGRDTCWALAEYRRATEPEPSRQAISPEDLEALTRLTAELRDPDAAQDVVLAALEARAAGSEVPTPEVIRRAQGLVKMRRRRQWATDPMTRNVGPSDGRPEI